jgi:hypothetical protein
MSVYKKMFRGHYFCPFRYLSNLVWPNKYF